MVADRLDQVAFGYVTSLARPTGNFIRHHIEKIELGREAAADW